MDKTFKNLKLYNAVVGIALLAQGVLMWFISDKDVKLPVTTNYLGGGDPTGMMPVAPELYAEWPVALLVAAFLVLSGVFLLGSAFVWRKQYESQISRGINLFRWAEYSITSSLMVVVIAMLCGIFDLSTLILIFALNATMILFGWMMEVHNQTTSKVDWTSYYFGCFAGVVPWIVMGLYFFNALSAGGEAVPDFVYYIFFSLFIAFNVFSVNMILQYAKIGKWRDYIYGERAYITFSLIAKALLAWQVWGGTLRF